MDTNLEKIAAELDAIALHCRKHLNPTVLMREQFGWNHPSLTRDDLADWAAEIADRVRDQDDQVITPELSKKLEGLIKRLSGFRNDTLQHVFNGDGHSAVPQYYIMMQYCDTVLSHIDGWGSFRGVYNRQARFRKNLAKIEGSYQLLVERADKLEEKVTAINEAKQVADELPETLQTLNTASKEAKQFRDKALTSSDEVGVLLEKARTVVDELRGHQERAKAIVDQATDALSAATARGLSESFYLRATQLQKSLRWWVGGLGAALCAVIAVGLVRFGELNKVLNQTTAPWYSIAIQLLMTGVGIGAPIWFAWLASKQIAHLFKVGEDYAFKASVAKAYEGFRLETLKYDSKYAEQLLATALARLDEEPLRYVDGCNHASPLAEMAESTPVKVVANSIPKLIGGVGKPDDAAVTPKDK